MTADIDLGARVFFIYYWSPLDQTSDSWKPLNKPLNPESTLRYNLSLKKKKAQIPLTEVDEQTAIILMNHSYSKDLKYLLTLKHLKPIYLGLLGPHKRREKLFSELMELSPEITYDFLDSIHGPAGLNIGAETPQEIAIAIVAEILSVIREQEPMLLKNKETGIHD